MKFLKTRKAWLILIIITPVVLGILYFGLKIYQEKQLFKAVEEGNIATAEILISKGVNVNARDLIRCTPLMSAVVNLDYEMCELLINSGADVEVKESKFGLTCLDLLNVKPADEKTSEAESEKVKKIEDLLRSQG